MGYPAFRSVLYTRGDGCEELATLLSDDARRVSGDLVEECIRERADLLVTRKPPGAFDLVNLAMPVNVARSKIDRVVAAVSGGPHSGLAAHLAQVLASRLAKPVAVASAFFDDENKAEAEAAVDRFADQMVEADRLVIGAADPQSFVTQLPERSLVVMGEPGGSLLSRLFFGAGARMRAAVPAGAVIVRHTEPRVFHLMEEPVFVGPLHHASDALRLHRASLIAVVENGLLVGTVRREELQTAGPSTPVGELMESPRSIDVAAHVSEDQGRDPLPVVDSRGRLLGTLFPGRISPS